MVGSLSFILNKKALKITSLKILILNAIDTDNYDLLTTTSINFIKEVETTFNIFMKHEQEDKKNIISFLEKKEAKLKMFKILTCIIGLITKINCVLNGNELYGMYRNQYIEGERRLTILRENYIYILRN